MLATAVSRSRRPVTMKPIFRRAAKKRIYASVESEFRRAKNTEPFLLQTYLRDTGEILSEFSLPIFVDGRHRSAFITGMDHQELLKG